MANIIEIDALTGVEVTTELSSKELEDLQSEYVANQELIQEQLEAKELARESALAKLAALGLTEEEIAAL